MNEKSETLQCALRQRNWCRAAINEKKDKKQNMGWKCCVPRCKSGYDQAPPTTSEVSEAPSTTAKLPFYRFLSEPGIRHSWIRNISRLE